MADQLVSQPDHGEPLTLADQDGNAFATPRLQLFFDDITRIINSIIPASAGGDPIESSLFTPSSIIYRPSFGVDVFPATINENEFVGRPLGGEIQGLSFAEAWGILGNGTTNITINQPGGANNFTIESNNSSRMFHVNGPANIVGMSPTGLAPTQGILHIRDSVAGGGSQGPVDADPDGSELVLEHDFFGGMSILIGNNGLGNIYSGSPNWGGAAHNVWFSHDIDFGGIGAPSSGLDILGDTFWSAVNDQFDGGTTGFYVNPFQDPLIAFQVNTLSEAPFMRIEYDSVGLVGRMGLSQGVSFAPTDGILHIFDQGVAGVVTAPANADAVVIEGPGNTGMTILSGDNGRSSIILGHPADNDDCEIRADWTNNWLNVSFDSTDLLRLNVLQGFIWNTTQNVFADFTVMSDNSVRLLYCNSLANRVTIADSGTQGDQGLLHVIAGGLSGTTAAANGNTLLLDSTTNAGMNILCANNGNGGIYFGNPANDPNDTFIKWFAGLNILGITVGGENAIQMRGTTGVQINAALGNTVDFTVLGDTSLELFKVDVGLELVSISKSSLVGTDGTFHIINADNSVSASGNGNLIVLEDAGEMGLSFLTSNTGFANIYYGNAGNGATIGHWRFDAANSTLEYFQNARSNFLLAPLENVFNEGGLSNIDLRAESDNNSKKLWLDASADELYTRMGGATTDASNARIGGMVSTDNTTQGTTAVTTEETLLSFSLPAFSLGVNGQGVRIKAWGTTAANANNKTVKLKFGATNVLDTGAVASNGETWHFEAEVFRTAGATQDAVSFVSFYNGVAIQAQITNPAETLTGAVVIAVSGQNGTAAANDIVAEGLTVEYI